MVHRRATVLCSFKTVFSLLMLLGLPKALLAASRVFDDFTELPGAILIDPPPATPFSPITVGSLTITAPYSPDGGFAGFLTATAADPGNGSGYIYTVPSGVHPSFLQLILSEPVAAFGISFLHQPAAYPGSTVGLSAPAGFEAYAQPGLADLVGSARTFGMLGLDTSSHDFVAVQSDSANIRSIKIFGTYPNFPSFAVDAYAASYTPIPEPCALFALLMFSPMLVRRRRR